MRPHADSHPRAFILRAAVVFCLALIACAALPAGSARALTVPTMTPRDRAVCGTWALQQVSSTSELNAYAAKVDAALAKPGVVGLSVRFPWKAVDTDFSLLDRAAQIASARGKQLSIRFMAGRHTPQRVFDAGSPYYTLTSGEKVPAPFGADGSPNTVFEAAWNEYVGRLASWSRGHGVHLLHLAWYGQDWAELNNGKEVRAIPGYTQQRWTEAHKRLVTLGAAHADDTLSVEAPLSGYGPLSGGVSQALADHVVATVGADSPAFFVQANGWSETGEWGAPSADVEAQFDSVWDRSVHRGLQMIQPQDYDWSAVFDRLHDVGASYAEVYLPSFTMARAALLESEIRRFSETRCVPGPDIHADVTPPSVTVSAPTSGAVVSGDVTVAVAAADDRGVAGTDLIVDGQVVASSTDPSGGAFPWSTPTVADGGHTVQARARDAAGNQAASAEVPVVVHNVAPASPVPAVVAGDGRATLTWPAVSGATRYEVRTKQTANPSWGAPVSADSPHTTFGLQNGTSYDFEVRALDVLGFASGWSATRTATPVAGDTVAPGAPGALRASPVYRKAAMLSWSASTDDRGVVAYVVTVAGRSPLVTSGTTRWLLDLSPNTQYTVTVQARDAAGNVSAPASLTFRTAAQNWAY